MTSEIYHTQLIKLSKPYFNRCNLYFVAHRVKFREQELHKKMEEKEKRKEESRQAEVEKERILEAIRQTVLFHC